MKTKLTAWALGGLMALAPAVLGQSAPADEKGHKTVTKEQVKTWTTTIDGKEYEVRPATPTYDGDTGLFHLSSAYTLPKGKVAFSLFRDNLDRDPKDVDISIHGLNFAIGATSKLEVFANAGLQNRVNTDAIFQPGFVNDYPFAGSATTYPRWQTGFGDIKLGAKYKFLDDYMGDGLGLALKAYVKVGTADEAKGLGTGKTAFGADLIASKTLGYKADLHASIGYQMNSDPDNIDLGNALKWGFGLNVPSCRYFQLQAEVTGSVYSDTTPKQTNPVDLVVGPVFWIKPGIFIRPAFSYNLNFDDRGLGSGSASKSGRQISIGYHPGTACCEIYTPPPPKPAPENRPPTVKCDVERSTLLPGETVRCRATGSDPDGDTLSYSWTASAGRVTGTGAEATFDSTGVASGTSVSVTVTATDGRGGTASSTCTVLVKDVVRKPETFTCLSGGFPRNLARLNNVDKACLDDVASRLKADPGSRIIIVGHADKGERYTDVIGKKRAEAVKAYLVKERGVDESRVVTKSAGAGKQLDLGTTALAHAKNRRVEVIFVPTGATAPEDSN
jgi:outer membrane protein OmpA-like peptidoglycan-associated protein